MKTYIPQSTLLLLLLAIFIFGNGINSSFLLDDYPNLKTLERLSNPLSFEAISSFLLSNPSGAFGRILSMATFTLQYQSWPTNPCAFKLANLLIHLINAILILLLINKILNIIAPTSKKNSQLSLIATTIWLIHPLQISTVLYVIQRMTELSTLFTVAGILIYLQGREHALIQPKYGYLFMITGLFGMTCLACLCKENGILLPVYVLLMEATILKNQTQPLHHKQFLYICFGLPILPICYFILTHFQNWVLSAYSLRSFSMEERLLTECRVLIDYLRLIVLPSFSGFGVFHDDYPLSHSLLHPISTLWSLMGLSAMLVTAFALRVTKPIITFSILWFFVAHSMESTLIPLEIYFEHRNYLAILGPIIGLCVTADQIIQHPQMQNLKHIIVGILILWFSYLMLISWSESKLWSQNPLITANVWAHDHPNSLRAQQYLANTYANAGDFEHAAQAYKNLTKPPHQDASAFLNWLALGCNKNFTDLPDIETAKAALLNTKYSTSIIGGLEKLVILKENKQCELGNLNLIELFNHALNNPFLIDHRYPLYILRGRLQSTIQLTDDAIDSFDHALKIKGDVEVALLEVKAYVEAGRLDDAEKKLPLATQANEYNTLTKVGYSKDIANWRLAIDNLRIKN